MREKGSTLQITHKSGPRWKWGMRDSLLLGSMGGAEETQTLSCSKLFPKKMSLHWPLTEDTRQALVKHEHLYLIYILTICT